MRFFAPFVGQLAALAVAGIGMMACAPAVAQRPVQVMRSEAGVSSCEVVTTVRARLYWTPSELKDPDAMARNATKKMKDDASHAGANYLHVDSMDVPNNEAAATAYSCPSSFKADLRSADVAFVDFNGQKRTINLPGEAPVISTAPPPPQPGLPGIGEAVATTTTTGATYSSSGELIGSSAKTSPSTAAASSSTESAKPTKKKGAGAGAAAKKKPAAAAKKKDTVLVTP